MTDPSRHETRAEVARADQPDHPTPAYLVALAWLAVGIPLAYGLWQTLLKASALFVH